VCVLRNCSCIDQIVPISDFLRTRDFRDTAQRTEIVGIVVGVVVIKQMFIVVIFVCRENRFRFCSHAWVVRRTR